MLGFDELSAMSRDELIAVWRNHFGTQPPKKMRSNTLARILSCEQQWERSGENRAAIRRKLERVIEADRKSGPAASEGTRLIREWHGRKHIVDVIDGAYHWNGKSWKSLSAIAREITGARWSGPRFFGVKG